MAVPDDAEQAELRGDHVLRQHGTASQCGKGAQFAPALVTKWLSPRVSAVALKAKSTNGRDEQRSDSSILHPFHAISDARIVPFLGENSARFFFSQLRHTKWA